MRVVVLDTGRGINAVKVALWREQLGLEERDEISLVSWFPPSGHLLLAEHLVCGPELRLGREPHQWPVLPPDEVPADATVLADHDAASGSQGADETVGGEEDEGLGLFELDEQLTEHEAGPAQAAAADQAPAEEEDAAEEDVLGDGGEVATDEVPAPPAPAVLSTNLSHLPVYDPRRVRQAVRWRRKWAQRRASRFAGRQVRRVRAVTRRTTHLPSTVVSSALRTRKDAISWEFALATTRSQTVNALIRTADVVVPVDQRSHKAAWLLARRHAGPDVIVTLPAAARALAARRTAA